MAQKKEIIISAIVVISLVAFFILDSAELLYDSLGVTICYTLVYFAVCYLYINQISTMKWRILIVALSLGLIIVLIFLHFYLHQRLWHFEDRLLYAINTVAITIFLLETFTQDRRSTVLYTSFLTEVVLLVNNREDSDKINQIFTVVGSIAVYIVLCTFHVKQIWDRRWNVAAIASIFVFTMAIGIILRIYWYNKGMLFAIIASINACLSVVPWLWTICAPTIKSWWQVSHEQEMIQEQYNFHEMDGLPTRFTTKELEIATSNFQAPVGEGASGTVFKGKLADGSLIAVKRIKWQPSGETEFQTEMTIIASRQHVNLARLLGFTISPRGDRYLIYPFLENGSLDAWLFADNTKRSHLSWMLRYRIAIDVAKALAYLHHECHHQILHLDIKPANILLDGDFRAQLSDFGISKLIEKDETGVMTRARGTVGYLAPEMLVPNAISTKSDVYSYGMVLLELLGGRRNLMSVIDKETQQLRRSYFPKIVREKLLQGEIMEAVDECLVNNEEINENDVTVLTRLALWCIQENPMLRPNMKEVVQVLEGHMPVQVLPESSMFVVNFLDVHPKCCISCQAREDNATLMSSNTLTITIQSGR